MTIRINMNAATFGTVAFWRSAAPHYGARNWRSAMDRFATQHGKAIAMLRDDSAIIVECQTDGRLVRHEIPAEAIRWHRSY